MATPRLYFAYGSNLDREQMARRCPTARPLERAVLPGYRLTFRARRGGYGVADVEPHAPGRVAGALWEVFPSDLEALDRYEGYPWLYRRETVQVQAARGQVRALIYVMQPGCDLAAPHPRYVEVLVRGYRAWGLDLSLLEEALRRARDGAGGRPAGPPAGTGPG